MKHIRAGLFVWFACAIASLVAAPSQQDGSPPAAWDRRAAAGYLDGRQTWWASWPNAARDHGTFCVSCHTALPYALARPALRAALSEAGPSAAERTLYENVTKRVTLWKEVDPFYSDQARGLPKTSESRGTEAILNAVIMARRDAQVGTLSGDTRMAFANLWALQMNTGDLKGAWAWLNFHYEPWEADAAPYYGAALAAVALGTAPGGYAASPEIQDRVKLLRDYLQRGSQSQHLLNRVMFLWASARLPGLATTEQRQAIVDAIYARQQDDGGWSLATLGSWKRLDGTALDTKSDGYATGIVTFALQQAGTPRTEAHVRRALAWLQQNQNPTDGRWAASSLNKQRDPATDAGRFMSDAATAFAVLALTEGQ